MNVSPGHSLLLHGSIVLLCGLLSGLPFWIAIVRGTSDGAVRAWRVAHTTLITCGLLMLVVDVIKPQLNLSAGQLSFLDWVLVFSGYNQLKID